MVVEAGVVMKDTPQEPERRRQESQRQRARGYGREDLGNETERLKVWHAQAALMFVVGEDMMMRVLIFVIMEVEGWRRLSIES